MKQFKALQALAVATVLVAGGMATLPVQAQLPGASDLVLFGPASNPLGAVGYVQIFETDASEFRPAFLPAAANVPNNTGVVFYEDTAQTILSDQLWVQNGFWYFASDPALVNFASLGITTAGALTEDGTQQDVSGFFFLPPGSMLVLSDIDVPEPTTLTLVGLGAAGLMIIRRRK